MFPPSGVGVVGCRMNLTLTRQSVTKRLGQRKEFVRGCEDQVRIGPSRRDSNGASLSGGTSDPNLSRRSGHILKMKVSPTMLLKTNALL